MSEQIVRVAARGDGVTADGQHVARGVTGDVLHSDGTLERGEHHVSPPCRHFERCGACAIQHCDESVLRQFVTDRVLHAAAGQQVEAEEVLPTHLSPPNSRRRATLHGLKTQRGVILGFHEERARRIVDVQECHVLLPELFALLAPLRAMLTKSAGRHPLDVSLTQTLRGVDCAIKGLAPEGLEATEAVLDFAQDHALARLSLDQGYGMEAMYDPNPTTIDLSGVQVALPQGAFLQPTADGERTLTSDVKSWLQGSERVADLFAGLGTFAFALAGTTRVEAFEAARDHMLACKQAAGRAQLPVEAHHRDLFRAPLQTDELNRFDAVVLDPPRAGARDQVTTLAQSDVAKIAYVSCNPASWARDGATLIEHGYRLKAVRPVGQFRWSTHVELTSLFEKA